MFRAPHHLPPHFRPIDTRVQLLIHQSTHHHIVSSHDIESMWLFDGGFFVVRRSNYALDGVFEYEVRHLVAAEEGSGEGSAVDG